MNNNNTKEQKSDYTKFGPEWKLEMLKQSKEELINWDLSLTKEKDELILRLKKLLFLLQNKEFIIDDIRKTSILKEITTVILEQSLSQNIEH